MPRRVEHQTDLITQLRQCGRTFIDGATPVLARQAAQIVADPFYPYSAEVVSGLFARVYRFTQSMLLDYHLIADDVGRIILRTMFESLVYLTFLVRKNDPKAFEEFRLYGVGQEKLYKMQLKRLVDDGKLKKSKELVAFIDSDSDDEIWDELVDVKLKNFEDIRKLTKTNECQLEDEYVLRFQPDSIVVHGHWPAVKEYNLQLCYEPMHRGHRVPNFGLPRLNFYHLAKAMSYCNAAYQLWIQHFKLADDLAALIKRYDKDVAKAMRMRAPRKAANAK